MIGSCARKKHFLSEKEAKKACKRIWKKNYQRMYYYKCPVCGNWALSKTSPQTFYYRNKARG